jgi:hypothetical protein
MVNHLTGTADYCIIEKKSIQESEMPLFVAGDALYRVTDVQTFGGQQVRNVYWYADTPVIVEPPLADIAAAFVTQIVSLIDNLQVSGIVHNSVFVEKFLVTGPTTFGTFASTGAGAVATETLPAFNAVGVRFTVTTRETRPGFKRIAGVPEADSAGTLLTAGALAAWQTATAGMDDTLVTATGDNLIPVVVRRTETVDGVTVLLPESEWRFQITTLREVMQSVRSQTSRRGPAI